MRCARHVAAIIKKKLNRILVTSRCRRRRREVEETVVRCPRDHRLGLRAAATAAPASCCELTEGLKETSVLVRSAEKRANPEGKAVRRPSIRVRVVGDR